MGSTLSISDVDVLDAQDVFSIENIEISQKYYRFFLLHPEYRGRLGERAKQSDAKIILSDRFIGFKKVEHQFGFDYKDLDSYLPMRIVDLLRLLFEDVLIFWMDDRVTFPVMEQFFSNQDRLVKIPLLREEIEGVLETKCSKKRSGSIHGSWCIATPKISWINSSKNFHQEMVRKMNGDIPSVLQQLFLIGVLQEKNFAISSFVRCKEDINVSGNSQSIAVGGVDSKNVRIYPFPHQGSRYLGSLLMKELKK